MADTITVKFKVMEDGSLKAVGKDADKAAAALNKTASASDKAASATKQHNKQQKGVAGATANSTKAFSKMTTGISGGLVPAYATLAANVFALTALFGVLSRNDSIAKLNEGLELTGQAAGKNLGMLSDRLQEVTGHAISAEEAMRAVAVGTSAGFSDAQLVGLTEVAKGASLALGRNMPDAIDRLIRGAAKLEPEILDELGIMVRLDDATTDYARTMGKTVKQLTSFERRMAFTNAIIEQGQQKFAAIAAEMEASGYSKLSASFSDLTKQGIELLNSFLKPVINFLSNNTAALATVMLAFGASISSTLLSSLSDMAHASAEAGKNAAELSKHTVKAIKPQEHMGKAFNKAALAMDNAEMSTEEYNAAVKKMQSSSRMTVNMMKKENPLRKLAIRDRNHLTKAVHLAALAEHKEGAAKALNMIQTHGLSAALAQHRAVLAANSATTAAATVGQDLQTAAIIRTRGAFFALASSAKFAGAALLTAMPYIMGAMMAVSLLYPLIQKLFGEEDNKLNAQIKKNTERFEEFTEVVAKYNIRIKHAASASEAWHNTIKPLSGLFEQVSTAMQDTNLAAETDRIIALAAATKRLAAAEKEQEKANKTTGGKASETVRDVINPLEIAASKKAIIAAAELDDDTLLVLREQSIAGLAELVASMGMMSEGLKGNEMGAMATQDAQNLLNTKYQEANAILMALAGNTDLSVEETKKSQAALQKLAQELKAGVKAYEDFNELVKQAKDQSATPTFGVMADELDTLTSAVTELEAITNNKGFYAAEEQAHRLVVEYGILGDEAYELGHTFMGTMVVLTKSGAVVRSNTQLVIDHQKAVEKLNADYKALKVSQEQLKSLSDLMDDDSDYLYTQKRDLALDELNLAKERLRLTKVGGEKAYNNALLVLEAERELLKLTKERMEVLAGRADDAGMGAAASATIAGVGATAGLQAGTVGDGPDDTFANKADKEAAISAQRRETARAALAGVAEDLKSIGPEGALMSSAIEGALNMQTAFSTAFEVMNTDAATTSEKIQAGLGAVGAVIGALAQMSKASSDQKIAGIDREIAAEKARDGKSAGSVAKLAALEKKKEQAKRKAFEMDKKMKMAQTVISTAQGVTAMLGAAPPPFNFALAGMVAAMGAQQLSMISGMTFQGGASSAPAAPSQIAVGSRNASVDLAKGQNAGGELAYARGEQGIGSGMTDFKPTSAFAGYKHRAGGGYVVGEQGPELFMPDTPGQIIPSGQGTGGQTNVNFSISAVDATGVEDLLMNQRGNIIGMIREAANEHGEMFLEGVQEKSY